MVALVSAAKSEQSNAERPHDGLSCWVMGTKNHVHLEDWKRRAQELKTHDTGVAVSKPAASRFHIKTQPSYLVTAIASLYKGADFIEQFMDNITSQSIFDDYCELVIVDAESPDGEAAVIERYLAKYKNIQYLRMNYRIGIYDAWNVGVKAARGTYLTNTNLDDLRRHDSLELQASVLDNLDFVDVVYQDFYYSFDPELSFEEVAAFDYKSNLPLVTPYSMLAFNSPHNAPMWRKRLHDELGLFDINYKSAGDYEFWMRCMAARKKFYKINDPHVVYYQNPNGLSTRPDTRGVVEARAIMKKYSRQLVSPHLTSEISTFADTVLGCDANYARDTAGTSDDRYRLVQAELRQLAKNTKYFGRSGKS